MLSTTVFNIIIYTRFNEDHSAGHLLRTSNFTNNKRNRFSTNNKIIWLVLKIKNIAIVKHMKIVNYRVTTYVTRDDHYLYSISNYLSILYTELYCVLLDNNITNRQYL